VFHFIKWQLKILHFGEMRLSEMHLLNKNIYKQLNKKNYEMHLLNKNIYNQLNKKNYEIYQS